MLFIRLVRTVIVCFGLTMALSLSAKTIVAVDSYNAGYPWSETNRTGFVENISDEHEVTFYEMDTKRISTELYAEKADAIWKEIVATNPDLVLTMDDNALKYLGERITDAGIPLVFLGVNHDPRTYFKDGKLPAKISGVMERPLLFQNIAYISQLLPMTHQRMLLMMDGGATSTGFFDKTLEGRNKVAFKGIDLDVFIAGSFNSWQSKIKSLSADDYDAILVGSFSTLQQNAAPNVGDGYILQWASENSPIPLFTFWSHRIGHGKTIGGLVLSGYEHGKIAAKMVNSILETGKYPLIGISKIGEPIFSESQLSRWGIDLPDYIRKRSQMVD
ncbi:hypothetical protein L3Q72_21575 [Vibrio sp. JC009]|uniref:ABC transporter substrate-binding protein n=1 Tax=Vibrio sp. JC009 TaxID=2912314 RepID=UPI0023B074AE|nr:hypothetical protein [Vibrio sp. JC009]WED23826.1 hypothetical protein L3Q72_21575 [Vibrio sp. JC009]